MLNEAACHGFHGDEADIQLPGALGQAQLPLIGNDREGILQGIVETAFQGFLRDADAVGGDRNMADGTLLFLLEQPIVDAVLLAGAVDPGGAVQLVDIDVIGAEHFKALLQVLLHDLRGGGGGFGGDDDIPADIAQGLTELKFAIGIGVGGIVEIDTGLIRGAEDGGGFALRDALDGQGAERGAADGKAGAAKTGIFHGGPP